MVIVMTQSLNQLIKFKKLLIINSNQRNISKKFKIFRKYKKQLIIHLNLKLISILMNRMIKNIY